MFIEPRPIVKKKNQIKKELIATMARVTTSAELQLDILKNFFFHAPIDTIEELLEEKKDLIENKEASIQLLLLYKKWSNL